MDSEFVTQLESIRSLVAECMAPRDAALEESAAFDAASKPGDGCVSKVDPAGALRYFPHLRLKEGWKLVGLEFRSRGNGNGVVYAIPADGKVELDHAPASPWEICPGVILDVPRLPGAAPSFMDAIESDGHFEAYLQASILFREFQEFGARWHGCSWSTHHVLSQDPWSESSAVKAKVGDRKDWAFQGRSPSHWLPTMERSPRRVTVKFYTFSGLGQDILYRHQDRYRPGCLVPSTRETVLATGPGGFVH